MSRFRAYAQLVRLPNVFTAWADIWLGALATIGVTGSSPTARWWLAFICLMAASSCLYFAGMVWNDFFDLEQDQRERPYRPIPSGRVARKTAARFGCALIAGGLALGCLAGIQAVGVDWTPGLLAGSIAILVLLYDSWLKRTWAGPVGMGGCRFLNVLLGLSVGGHVGRNSASFGDQGNWHFHLAMIVGVYIVGVTWFARTEARTSKPSILIRGAAFMLVGLLLALPLPIWFPPGTSSPIFPYLLVGLGFWVGLPVVNAISRPTPALVQFAVKRAIMGLVVLDAALATALAGFSGLIILVLLVPAMYLGRWIYST
jgi:4-hydroxybenzoate polyprenyltransferase